MAVYTLTLLTGNRDTAKLAEEISRASEVGLPAMTGELYR